MAMRDKGKNEQKNRKIRPDELTKGKKAKTELSEDELSKVSGGIAVTKDTDIPSPKLHD